MEIPLAPQATTALPGSLDKIRVMRQRAEGGYSLFHPDDPRIEWEYTVPRSDNVSLRDLYAAVKEHEHSYYDRND